MGDRPDVEAPRGVEPTGTNSRTATHTPTHTGWQEQTRASLGRQGDTLHVTWINPSVASTIRSPTHHNPPREHVETRSQGMHNTRFAAAMAQGRRPDPFRTRKLRPGTAMVLHPEGCGRVARRRTQTSQGGDTTTCPLPFHIPAYPHNPTAPGTPGIKNRTYDPQQDFARPLLNMPASSSRSGFHVSASILWQSQSFVKPVFSILVNMRIVFCFITLEPSDSDFRPGVSPSYHEKYILFLVTA